MICVQIGGHWRSAKFHSKAGVLANKVAKRTAHERKMKYYYCIHQERTKGQRELIPNIGPITIVTPLKLFFERIGFPADNISSRVVWKLRGVINVQKHVGSARVILP